MKNRIEWMLHNYYEELLRRQLMFNKPSPWGRVIEDGGMTGGEFKSKLPSSRIDFTDPDIIQAFKETKKLLLNLQRKNERWYVAICLRYQRRIDGSQLPTAKAAEIMRVSANAYDQMCHRARVWLAENYRTTISSVSPEKKHDM